MCERTERPSAEFGSKAEQQDSIFGRSRIARWLSVPWRGLAARMVLRHTAILSGTVQNQETDCDVDLVVQWYIQGEARGDPRQSLSYCANFSPHGPDVPCLPNLVTASV